MMKALVLYHSLFGNTRTVAMSLAKGIQESGVDVTCIGIETFDISRICEYEFIAIGSPTHMIRTSKEMKEFLLRLDTYDLKGKLGFSFDTRTDSRMNDRKWSVFENSAARVIERKMKRLKMKIIRPRQSAIVTGREGPLDSGVEDTFLEIGREIGRTLEGLEKPVIIES
ncbi:MAG: flavodoxin family protein [Promethearchaeota archaeon]